MQITFYPFTDGFDSFKELNQKEIPVSYIQINNSGMDEFNNLIDTLKKNYTYGFVKTKGNYISKCIRNYNSFEVEATKNSVQIIMILSYGAAKVQFKNATVEDNG